MPRSKERQTLKSPAKQLRIAYKPWLKRLGRSAKAWRSTFVQSRIVLTAKSISLAKRPKN